MTKASWTWPTRRPPPKPDLAPAQAGEQAEKARKFAKDALTTCARVRVGERSYAREA